MTIQPKTMTMMMRTTMSSNMIAGIVAAADIVAAVRKLIRSTGYFVGISAASAAATVTAAMLWTEEDCSVS